MGQLFQNRPEILFGCFGTTLAGRWKHAEGLYVSQGLAARFAIYPGVGHAVTPLIEMDIARFFEERIRNVFPKGCSHDLGERFLGIYKSNCP